MAEILNWEHEYRAHAARWAAGDEREWSLGVLATSRGEHARAQSWQAIWDARWEIEWKWGDL